jgi:hypothetical protein
VWYVIYEGYVYLRLVVFLTCSELGYLILEKDLKLIFLLGEAAT